MVAGTEAAVEEAAAGGSGDVQGGRIGEGRCEGRQQPQPDGSRPLLGLGSCPDSHRRRSAGISIPTDGLVDGMSAGRAEEAQGAATFAYSFMCLMRIGTYFCTCRIYVCVVQ